MSSDADVQANFFYYVDCYLNNNGVTPNAQEYQNFASSQFTYGQDGSGYWVIQSWNPTSPAQPSEATLRTITTSAITTFQKFMDAALFEYYEPVPYQTLFDLQNQVRNIRLQSDYNDTQF